MNGIKYLLYKLKSRKRINIDLSKVGYIFNLVLLTISIILLSIVAYFGITDIQKEKLAIKTEGIISSIDYNKNDYIAKIKYVVNGNSYESSIKTNAESAVSDKVVIKYNKEKPEEIIENNHIGYIVIVGIISAILLIKSLSYLLPYLRNAIMIKNVRKKGFYVDATIVEVFINNNKIKLFGLYPYRIRLKYINPADGNTLIFDSQDSYANLKQIVEDYKINTLPVFLNPKNPNIYYVDLDIILPKKRR